MQQDPIKKRWENSTLRVVPKGYIIYYGRGRKTAMEINNNDLKPNEGWDKSDFNFDSIPSNNQVAKDSTVSPNHDISFSFMDLFRIKKFKSSILQLKNENQSLSSELSSSKKQIEEFNALMTPELKDIQKAKDVLNNLSKEIKSRQEASDSLQRQTEELNTTIAELSNVVQEKQREISWADEELQLREFGLYKPKYDFADSTQYKDRLTQIRNEQKQLIKSNNAVLGSDNWSVNEDPIKGRKMVNDMKKLLLRAFNDECDVTISKVKYSNFSSASDKIYKSAELISKLGKIMSIRISPQYIELKQTELHLAFEYQQKKEEEKEALRAAKAEARETAKLQQEIQAKRKLLEKEQHHYEKAYSNILKHIKNDPENSDLLSKKEEIEAHLKEIDANFKDIDYREANIKAGYVYIISNVGAFGENIYKIGMTRRLDPQERVDELGDASVPFNFDVHAMIFSEDAPALEAALHRAFETKKLNLVNQRREFFNVTLDEIKQVVAENFDKTVEFVDVPEANQYRISEKMKAQGVFHL